MREIRGPFENIGRLVHDKAVQTRKIEKLRHMQTQARALAEEAFSLGFPNLGGTFLSAGEQAGNLAKFTENA